MRRSSAVVVLAGVIGALSFFAFRLWGMLISLPIAVALTWLAEGDQP